MFKKLRQNKKGFTLVEIIVVLVILAILAAITIPTMLGFVNDARNKALVNEARTAYVAAQSIASETYAVNKDANVIAAIKTDSNTMTDKMKELTNVAVENADATINIDVEVTDGVVTRFKYWKDGTAVIIAKGADAAAEANKEPSFAPLTATTASSNA